MHYDWALGLGVIAAAVFAATGGLLALSLVQAKALAAKASVFLPADGLAGFLFDGETLVDATPQARALLANSPVTGSAWARLMAYLTPRFPGLEAQLSDLGALGRTTLASAGDQVPPLVLEAELRGGMTRIALLDAEEEGQGCGLDRLLQNALQDEVTQLRATVAQAPCLIWRENMAGEVTWANASYLRHAMQQLPPGQDLAWPLQRIFDRTASAQGATGQRQKLDHPGGASNWYELIGFAEDSGRLMFGVPADAAVQAETSLREFMQTLTKTFAHLPIGLAIFDRQRQLQLFNPALLDLSGLQPDFLSLRPTLFAFLDAMRDRNMIPEPKDYRFWRKQMTELEKAAASGHYEEIWSLPSGQTYRVIGRPHPNGALALMFEDISTEMSRTRRYRADLELGQAVVDAMDQGLAVFSQAGVLVMANDAYATLWGHDPAATLGESGVSALCAHWRDHSAPSPMWAEVETFMSTLGDRKSWGGPARLADGRLIDCRFTPIAGGATLATFALAAPAEGQGARIAAAQTRKTA